MPGTLIQRQWPGKPDGDPLARAHRAGILRRVPHARERRADPAGRVLQRQRDVRDQHRAGGLDRDTAWSVELSLRIQCRTRRRERAAGGAGGSSGAARRHRCGWRQPTRKPRGRCRHAGRLPRVCGRSTSGTTTTIACSQEIPTRTACLAAPPGACTAGQMIVPTASMRSRRSWRCRSRSDYFPGRDRTLFAELSWQR